MFPCLARNDQANLRRRHAIFNGKFSLHFASGNPLADLLNLGVRQRSGRYLEALDTYLHAHDWQIPPLCALVRWWRR